MTVGADKYGLNVETTAHFSSERTLSNKTYLRRLHIKFKDAQRLFSCAPEMQQSSLFDQEMGAARYLPDKTVVRTEVSLLDALGRYWPVQYECVLHGGQRHSRLKRGWAKLCRANSFSTGDKIQFRTFTTRDSLTMIKVDKITCATWKASLE